MFTMDNTEGYTQEQLEMLNEVFEWLVDGGMEEQQAADYISNVWTEGDTEEELLSKVS